METIIEQQRRCHEERERLLDCMVKELLFDKKTHKDKINGDQRLKILLDRYQECSYNLSELYDDSDGLRKEELAAISSRGGDFNEFYQRLKVLREFHKKHPNEISVPMSAEFDAINKAREDPKEKDETLVAFTDEEGYGRYLDLHGLFNQYNNLKGFKKIDYLSYLSTFDQLYDISKDKKTGKFREYIIALLEYLESYITRVKPLLNMSKEMEVIKQDFDKQWSVGSFPGWPKETTGALAHAGAYLDLSAFASAEELASLGLDRLKSALMALGLKCGGKLDERALRLFQTKGKSLDDLPVAMFAKQKPRAIPASVLGKQQEVAFLEAQVYRFVEILSEQRHDTIESIQRKQARTGEEREESEEELSAPESDDEEEEVLYNPKNLPLGWDGKPIPYWLFKLHGLNLYYNCEICGNHKYRGPKMFQRHFSEWRHAHGMRCLGIPNTAHFANVTQIEDALELWRKLSHEKEVAHWRPDVEEEFEDSHGNVVTQKIFEDLKRQGLL